MKNARIAGQLQSENCKKNIGPIITVSIFRPLVRTKIPAFVPKRFIAPLRLSLCGEKKNLEGAKFVWQRYPKKFRTGKKNALRVEIFGETYNFRTSPKKLRFLAFFCLFLQFRRLASFAFCCLFSLLLALRIRRKPYVRATNAIGQCNQVKGVDQNTPNDIFLEMNDINRTPMRDQKPDRSNFQETKKVAQVQASWVAFPQAP